MYIRAFDDIRILPLDGWGERYDGTARIAFMNAGRDVPRAVAKYLGDRAVIIDDNDTDRLYYSCDSYTAPCGISRSGPRYNKGRQNTGPYSPEPPAI